MEMKTKNARPFRSGLELGGASGQKGGQLWPKVTNFSAPKNWKMGKNDPFLAPQAPKFFKNQGDLANIRPFLSKLKILLHENAYLYINCPKK